MRKKEQTFLEKEVACSREEQCGPWGGPSGGLSTLLQALISDQHPLMCCGCCFLLRKESTSIPGPECRKQTQPTGTCPIRRDLLLTEVAETRGRQTPSPPGNSMGGGLRVLEEGAPGDVRPWRTSYQSNSIVRVTQR